MASHGKSSSSGRRHRRKHRSGSDRSRTGQPRRNLALSGVDIAIGIALFGVPFLIGGRIAAGEMALILSATIASICWAVYLYQNPDAGWIRSKAEPLLLAIIALALLQITPLPPSVVETVSPEIAELFPWTGDDQTEVASQPWPYLSLSVGKTRRALPTGLSYILLFLITVQRIRRVEHAERIMRWFCVSATLMAVFGLIQWATSNGLYYWFFEYPNGTTADRVKGAFPNKNHFAQFIALAIGPLTWWVMTSGKAAAGAGWSRNTSAPQQIQLGIIVGGLALVLSSLVLSQSRGALLASAIGVSLLVVLLSLRAFVTIRQAGLLFGVGALAGIILFLIGDERSTQRLDFWSVNGRIPIWKANLDIIEDFPIVGAGISSHRQIHHRYLDEPFATKEFSHAESGYLQIASETGLVGLTLLALCLMMCFYWCARGIQISQERSTTIALLGLTCSLIVSCVQSVADFVWYIEGCTVPVVILMACACRLYQLEYERTAPDRATAPRRMPRWAVAGLACLFMAGSAWMLNTTGPSLMAERDWYTYRALTSSPTVEQDLTTEGEDGDSDELAATFHQKLLAIHGATRANPNDSRFHLRLGLFYHTLFHYLQSQSDTPFSLSQFRDTAYTGGFASHGELREWLERSVGDNLKYADAARAHFRRAVELNPLHHQAWLYLSELGFLAGRPEGFDRQCVQQALRLRPFDSQTLYAAGRDAMAAGEYEVALDYWKRSFNRSEDYQEHILRILAEFLPSQIATFVIDSFDPDIDGLERVVKVTEEFGLTDDRDQALTVLVEKLTQRAQEPGNRKRVYDWLKAYDAYAKLQQPQKAAECLDQAMTLERSNFVVRLEYGRWMYLQRDFDTARQHLEWCSRMRPNHQKVKRLLKEVNTALDAPRPVRFAGATSDDLATPDNRTSP